MSYDRDQYIDLLIGVFYRSWSSVSFGIFTPFTLTWYPKIDGCDS